MPELPEVETVKRGLEPVLKGKTLVDLILNRENLRFPFPDNMTTSLRHSKIQNLRRRGKYILIDFANDLTLVVHLGMSGSFAINPSEAKKHDHVIFTTNENDRIVYNDPRRFGYMILSDTSTVEGIPSFVSMGVEPLGNHLHSDYLWDKLKARTMPIKVALLDQSIIAGIGNIYACEALYMAGISPLRAANSLQHFELSNLISAIRTVLQSAIESGGSSLRDHRQTDGEMGYFQHNFKVYDRQGEPCPETGCTIKKITQSGRSTFYSPVWQK